MCVCNCHFKKNHPKAIEEVGQRSLKSAWHSNDGYFTLKYNAKIQRNKQLGERSSALKFLLIPKRRREKRRKRKKTTKSTLITENSHTDALIQSNCQCSTYMTCIHTDYSV